MKYGDTIRQRSVPEWGYYNIDYDYLKDLIRHHTTSGTSKAVAIPGQGSDSVRAFRIIFLEVLNTQHDRVSLFVRSKSGEIERRLQYISQKLELLRARYVGSVPASRLTVRTVERYAKVDADMTRAAEDICSLSRFQAVQRTGFTKILKKYKRWTKDEELKHDFEESVMSQQDSLFQLNLTLLLDRYVSLLSALRSVFDHETAPVVGSDVANARSSTAQISRACGTGSETDFDLALTTVPLGPQGKRAAYWVHCDHIVELQLLLLQQMRLFSRNRSLSPQNRFSHTTSAYQKSSAITGDKYLGNEEDVALVILDHAESFAMKQNASTIASSEVAQGTIAMKAAGNIQCSSSGMAAVIVNTESNFQGQSLPNTKVAHVERQQLQDFLDPSMELPKSSLLRNQTDEQNELIQQNTLAVRQWLSEHEMTDPIAGVVSKRIRLCGLRNDSAGGLWASLDTNVHMKSSVLEDLKSEEWPCMTQSRLNKFPHAILDVRCEGVQTTSLINLLDQSHLVERVRGFSLEVHALWTCCRPVTMSQPLWIPLLEKDIRKIPRLASKRAGKGKGSAAGTQSQGSSPYTSASGTSYGGESSPLAPLDIDSSATSAQGCLDPPPLRAFRKKHPRSDMKSPPLIPQTTSHTKTQRYWNEYDDPESELEDSEYYIYVNPDAPIAFPGREKLKAWTKKITRLIGMHDEDEAIPSAAVESTISSDERTAEVSSLPYSRQYGTFPPSYRAKSYELFLKSLFRWFYHPHNDAEVLSDHHIPLIEAEARQSSTENVRVHIFAACLAVAISADAILCLGAVTGWRSLGSPADIAVLLVVNVTLVLSFVVLLALKMRKVRLG